MVSTGGKVNYRIAVDGAIKESEILDVKTEGSGRGTYSIIDMSKTYTGYDRPVKMIATDGYMTTTFKAREKISSVGISAKYGHSTATVTPSVNFGSSASISFSPQIIVESGAEAYDRVELKN